ncbi:prepilin peptidase [Cytobacillus sp. FJAT-54145]|uniref:Prepilin peptidase n=1 Tax=Cytobacillus spartinae TaxID=3299023 RepID=A0ABW6KAL2_9BACI
MEHLSTFSLYLVLMFSAISVLTDLKWRIVPNQLLLIGLAFGVYMRMFEGDWIAGFLGAGLALLLTLPFFIAGGLGAGDVKLLMLIGFFTNASYSLTSFFITALVGGILSILAMLLSKKRSSALFQFKYIFFSVVYLKKLPQLDEQSSVTLPYCIPIFVGNVLTILIAR